VCIWGGGVLQHIPQGAGARGTAAAVSGGLGGGGEVSGSVSSEVGFQPVEVLLRDTFPAPTEMLQL
jgi:hypothetical protein